MFTIYGFGSARQTFVRAKINIVGEHSLQSSTMGVGADIIKSDKSGAMGAKNVESKQMQ